MHLYLCLQMSGLNSCVCMLRVVINASVSVPADERFEQLCMHAEGLVESSNRQERDGDLPQALLYCNRAIGTT